jgi:hypothetical protein
MKFFLILSNVMHVTFIGFLFFILLLKITLAIDEINIKFIWLNSEKISNFSVLISDFWELIKSFKS